MNKENVLSWKETLSGLSPVARARWFYQEQLILSLSSDVGQAEEERKTGNHSQVEEIFQGWTADEKDQKVLSKLEFRERQRKVNLAPEKDLIKVGLTGLGRIEHVDANSQLKRAPETEQLPVMERIKQATLLYARLGLETLVPWTIHGGSIHWISEIAQDTGNTQTILGNPQEAQKIMMEAIKSTSQILKVLWNKVDLNTPEKQLREINYEAWKLRKIFLGSLSALGILWARQAKIDRHLTTMIGGLMLVSEANKYEPNPHRLATIAIWTIRSGFNKNYLGGIIDKVEAFMVGTRSFTWVFLIYPIETLKTLYQNLKED